MKWISVEDKLPKKGELVIITNGDLISCGCVVIEESEYWEQVNSTTKKLTKEKPFIWFDTHPSYDCFDETHWMPLPEPPDTDKG